MSLSVTNRMNTSTEKPSLSSRVLVTKPINWRELQFIQNDDFKNWSPEAKLRLKTSVISNNFTQPFYVWQEPQTENIFCLDGKHRTIILEELSQEGHDIPEKLPATFIFCKDKTEAAKLVLIYSSIYAKITEQGLFDFVTMYELDYERMKMEIDLPSLDPIEIEALFNTGDTSREQIIIQSLHERFIIPPFSVFDTRQGYWQDRKKKWSQLFDSQKTRESVELIAKSGQSTGIYELRNKMRAKLGRDPEWEEILSYAKSKKMHVYEGASIFDPVLCEVIYTWFCPGKADILDPFAGGSVRGIVAGILGHNYLGIDLRDDQVKANQDQWNKLQQHDAAVSWLTGDSNVVLEQLRDDVDFIFSCPPYHDLEKYTDDPADLSNMDYHTFCDVYRSIITKSMQRLKQNRFACFVVGDIRGKDGFYRNFVSETIDGFQKCIDETGAPAKLYNEITLINVLGSLPIRIGRQFNRNRKVGKTHQNILVFYKGDPNKIKEEFPEIKLGESLEDNDYQRNIALSIVED
jgi:DNA modification methylase